jgi:hypothetical protein
MTFSILRKEDKIIYSGEIEREGEMDSIFIQRVSSEIVKQVSKAWVDEFGADLLAKIAPDEVEKAIKQAIAQKILK